MLRVQKKIFTLLALVMGIMLMFSACQANTPAATAVAEQQEDAVEQQENVAEQSVEEEQEEDIEESSYQLEGIMEMLLSEANDVIVTDTHVTFTDDSLRESVTIEKNPERVAVLFGSHASLYTEAGGTVSIGIGGASAIDLYIEQLGRNILEDDGVVTIAASSSANTWDVEAILAERPDLIIVSTAMSGYNVMSGPAEAAGIPIIALTYSGVNDYLKWFKVFSHINSRQDLWESVGFATAYDIANIMLKAPTENNPTVLSLLLMPASNSFEANLGGSDMGVVIGHLNGRNVAAEQWTDSEAVRVAIDFESMFNLNPDMILIQRSDSEEEARARVDEMVAGNPIWESLDAVQNERIYFMPRELFHLRPNSMYNQAYQFMAELLYPDASFSR